MNRVRETLDLCIEIFNRFPYFIFALFMESSDQYALSFLQLDKPVLPEKKVLSIYYYDTILFLLFVYMGLIQQFVEQRMKI